MGKNNTELLKIASKHLGQGGAVFRKYCGLPSGAAWCNAFVTYIFNEGGDAALYCGGKKQTYCPTSMKLCAKDMAQIPIYLAMPMDVIYFDWDRNGVPNHIGFVRSKVSTSSINTIEGNTSNKVMNKTRPSKYVCAIFRPHFKPTSAFKDKALAIDGVMGYQTIYGLQKALKVLKYYDGSIDGILGLKTVKALQQWAGCTQDGCWQKGTSRAVQKRILATVDGDFGKNSVKQLQKFINANAFPSTGGSVATAPSVTKPKPSKQAEKAVAWARSIAKGGKYTYKKFNNKDKKTKQCPICHKLTGKYKGWNCIGFVSACWYHGAGLKQIKCACNGIGTDSFFTKVTAKSWADRNGKGWQMIGNGSKGGADIPASQLIAGDTLICYDGSGKFHHIALYTGNNKYIDDTNTTTPHIAERPYTRLTNKYHVTRAFRYVG